MNYIITNRMLKLEQNIKLKCIRNAVKDEIMKCNPTDMFKARAHTHNTIINKHKHLKIKYNFKQQQKKNM